MAVSKELKEQAKKDIFDLLEKYGRDGDLPGLYLKYKDDIPKSTFYRWIRDVHASGAPVQKALRKAKKRVAKKARKKGIKEKADIVVEVAGEVVDALPVVPDAEDIAGVGLTEMSRKLAFCMTELERIIEYSKNAEGKIRNAKMMMQAIEGLRRTIDSTTRLMEMLWDIRRTEQFHKAIFNRLRERDPEFVELVLADLKQINADWGIQI